MAGFEETYNIFLIPEPNRPTLPVSPNPSPDFGWENAVRKDLQVIAGTKIGNALLNSLKWHGVPVTVQIPRPGVCGAGTWPPDDYIPPGTASNVSTGPNIWYSPYNYQLGHKCTAIYQGLGQIYIDGHEVLLHELVHALRMTSTKFKAVAAGKGFAFHNTSEEVYAVLIQGIYASERGTKIRASQTRHFEMDKELAGSFEFFQTGTESFKYVMDFCSQNPGFTRMIAQVATGFNPIRAYYFDPSRALRLSQSTLAKQRDVLQPIKRDIYGFLKNQLTGAAP